MTVGRLAPTPSGHLHLGNALAFGAAWLSARGQGGRLLLRVEDLDRGRARDGVARAQREDLRWLGLDWDAEVSPQSARRYTLDGLETFRCDCPRARRLAGGCRCRDAGKTQGAWRLASRPQSFVDAVWGPQRFPGENPVLMHADGTPAYPLAVVLDDIRDGVTEVVRGADLLPATADQVTCWNALGRTPPRWMHTPVLFGPDGRKLSKSHGSTEIRALRAAGWTPEDVWRLLLPMLGIQGGRLAEAVLAPERVPRRDFTV